MRITFWQKSGMAAVTCCDCQKLGPPARLPPSVAESRKCVPYFLMMLSVMALRLGRLPSCLMVCRNSGSSGRAKPLFSCLSRARLFTFQRPNSLPGEEHGQDTHFSGRPSSESPESQNTQNSRLKLPAFSGHTTGVLGALGMGDRK